jgi:Ca-activated chloride channel homolog
MRSITWINFLRSHMVSSTEQSKVHIEPLADPSIRLRQGFAGQVRNFTQLVRHSSEGATAGDVYRLMLFILLIVIPWKSFAIFDYDLAIRESQKGNWPQATAQFKKVLTEHPDCADILYDSGVSAYKNAEYDKALAYFTKAGDSLNAKQVLREQAYFNAGNAQVQLKQLQEALESYEKVLTLNPDHEKAKHNKEIVKKMLEREKEQKDQEKKEEENKDKENKENQQSNNDENKNNNEQKNQDPKQSQENKKNNNKQENNEQNQKSEKQEQQQKQEKEKKEQQQKSADTKDKADKQKQDKENQSQKQEQQKKESAAKQEKSQEDKQEKESADKQTTQKLSAALEHALKEREKKDAQLNKQMIKAMAAETHNGGKNASNCW